METESHSFLEISPIRSRIRDIHRELTFQNTIPFDEWIRTGKSCIFFLRRILSYNYKTRYHILKRIEPDISDTVLITHHGFPYLGHRTVYEWTMREMLNRCQHNFENDILSDVLNTRDPDEIWAFHIIARRPFHYTFHSPSSYIWNQLMDSFDGTPRWIRCLVVFLCIISSTSSHSSFSQTYLQNGWDIYMTPNRIFQLLHTTIILYKNESIDDIIRSIRYTNSNETSRNINRGELLFVSMLKLCMPYLYEDDEYSSNIIEDSVKWIFRSFPEWGYSLENNDL